MPRKRKCARAFQRKHKPLTPQQELELRIGPLSERSAFPDEATRRRGWFQHRDELKALLPPDGRSWAFVVYEGGGFQADEGGRILAALARIDQEKSSAS